MIELAALADQALPLLGRQVLATYDDDSVVVWQAHCPEVARPALDSGHLGGPAWSTDRLSRLRLSLPSLLDRCDWGRRVGRERILAISLKRTGFEAMLRQAAHAAFEPAIYASTASWRLATRYTNVVIDWFPDRDTTGAELARETPRLGLRHDALGRFASEWVLAIEDWTEWVVEHRQSRGSDLGVPVVRPYLLSPSDLDRLAGRVSSDVC